MLETLTTTEEMITNATPVSAHPDKLREQMAENGVSLFVYTCILWVVSIVTN